MPYRYRRVDADLVMDLVLCVPYLSVEQAAILQTEQPIWYEQNREAIEQWLASDEGAA